MLTKYKFFYITYFIQKVIASAHIIEKEYPTAHISEKEYPTAHIVEKEYPTLWGCFTKVRAHKKLWFALKCENSIGYGLDDKGTAVRFP
jgi:hypothetical protein